MSTEQFRGAVFSAIEVWGATGFPALPLVFENGPVPDEDKIGPLWLDCEIRWYGAHVAAMGERPLDRDTGAVSLNVFHKNADGTASPDQILDSLRALFRHKRIGGGLTSAPQRTTPTKLRGWYKVGLLVPFYLDRD